MYDSVNEAVIAWLGETVKQIELPMDITERCGISTGRIR
jgi:hypothetical protein